VSDDFDEIRWLGDHLAELKDGYAGMWIAVKKGEVIAAANNVAGLRAALPASVERPFVTRIEPSDENGLTAFGLY
jgi:hypothetical protein